ncbi:MAG: hypothetical protein JRI44_11860 [Deltaproteobacteria bacterium]|nr:hypothetical protein [Deltaproteobacteria bacterium]
MANGTISKPENRLGIVGWFYAGSFSFERYAYILHRITGLGILLYFLLHIFGSSARISGQSSWESLMHFLGKPIFVAGEYLVFIAFCFHAMNGIRLILGELGFSIGKPGRPVYPYRISLNRQRPLLVVFMIIAVIFILLGGYDFFIAGH